MQDFFPAAFIVQLYNKFFQFLYATCTSPIMHLICPPKFCTTSIFISPGYNSRPKRNENNAYAKFWGANKVHYGRCVSGVFTDSSPANHT